MLNPTLVLNYIKENVSFPFQVLEMSDIQILTYINNFILNRFSIFIPDKKKIGIDCSDPNIQTSIENEILLIDPDNRQIIGVVEFIPDFTSSIITGHPYFGVTSYSKLPEFMLNVERARNAEKWGLVTPEFKFEEPNIIRSNPTYKGHLTVVYERVHSETYSTIPLWAEQYFLDYCLGHIQILLGNKRKKFTSIQTPYGEVPLNADEIKSDGKELVDKIEEKLQTYNPSIIIDIG